MTTCVFCGKELIHPMDAGWVSLMWFDESDEETPWEAQFCSLGCVADWATAITAVPEPA